jgi:hypothetical protein
MMNRLKLVSILIVLIVVGILLGQNRELLSLKFFCPDLSSESCLYRTPTLPLAAWMGIFAIAGILSSLIWQFLNQVATPTQTTQKSTRPRYTDKSPDNSRENRVPNRQVEYTRPQTTFSSNNTNTKPVSDWEQPKSEDWETNPLNKTTKEVRTNPTTNRIPPETEERDRNLNRVDSVYSYKFRDEKESRNEAISDRKKENVDDVYDANYRTVKSPQSPTSDRSEEDEEWI